MGPKRKPDGIHGVHLIANVGDVIDQSKVLYCKDLWVRRRVDVEAWEWENPRELPLLDGGLDLRGPHQIRLLRCCGSLIGNRYIVIRTSHLVLCAVAAM